MSSSAWIDMVDLRSHAVTAAGLQDIMRACTRHTPQQQEVSLGVSINSSACTDLIT
jgi:hypothetical protein